ncbi:MAG TPA: VIT1/CCC1 transporter family protein [Spirillospora sp.]
MSGGDPGTPAERHHRHRDVTGGWLRPAVFGAMDGLVSNFALIAGVAGGRADPKVVLLAGLAGLAAGAFSMAAGEYISVASQSELAEAEIEVERRELLRHPLAEEQELAGVFEARGVDPETAAEVARQLSRNPDDALEVHTREELGVTPDDLPSPVLAAGSSFLSFGVGALLPVLPYVLGASSLWPAAVVAALGLFGAGALVARITTRPWWFGGARQLLFGAAAAAITYGVGALIGADGGL